MAKLIVNICSPTQYLSKGTFTDCLRKCLYLFQLLLVPRWQTDAQAGQRLQLRQSSGNCLKILKKDLVTFNLIRIILHWIHHRNTEHSENDVITVPHHWSGRQQKYCTSWNVPLPRKYIGILSLSQCHWNRRQISTSQHHASASYTSYCKTQSQKHTGMRHNLNDSHITPK